MKHQLETDYLQLYTYDYPVNYDFHLKEIKDLFARDIGSFLISFNSLENELNIAIAECINKDSHRVGYLIIENLSTKNKVELFYKLYLSVVSSTRLKRLLHSLYLKLIDLNNFRNIIVHGNWALYSKGSFVRYKIVIDNEEGFVKYKVAKVDKKVFRLKIKEIIGLEGKITKFI